MQKITILFFLLFASLAGFSQSYEGTATYNKKTLPAIIADYPYSDDVVLGAIKDDLKKKGFTGKSNKGFWEYKGVLMNELGPDRLDLYIKVERKSKKEKDASILTMMAAKGYENFVSRSSDAAVSDGVRTLADSWLPAITAHALELDIAGQEENLKKAEKKLSTLITESSNLEKKRLQLEQSIGTNKTDITKQEAEVESQKKVLDNLKLKRNPTTTE